MDPAIRPMVEKYLRKSPENLRQAVAVTGRYHYTDSPFVHRFSAFGWSVYALSPPIRAKVTMSLFSAVELAPRDPILGLNEAFIADPRTDKVYLGVGVYCNEDGCILLLLAVIDAVTYRQRVVYGKRAGSGGCRFT